MKYFLILFIFLPTIIFAQTTDVTYNDSLEFAKKQIVGGNYAQAEKTLRNLNGTKNVQEEIEKWFLLGQVYMAKGDFDSAIKIYRKILDKQPDLSRVRLELATSLFFNKQYQQAENHFLFVRADRNTPNEVVQKINLFLTAIRQQRNWNANFSFGIIPDSNLNYATGRREECINTMFGILCRELEDKSTGIGIQYGLAGDYYIKMTDNFGIKTSASFYALDFSNSTFDDYMLYMAAGPRYVLGDIGEISIQPFTQLRWYGGEYYNTVPGVRADIDLDLTKRIHLSFGGSYSKDVYHNDNLDNILRGDEYTTYIQPRYYINNKSFAFLGLTYVTNTAKLKSYGSDSLYYSIGYFGELPLTLSLYARLDLTQTKYKDSQFFIMDDYTVNKFTRKDIGYRAYLRLSSRYLEYKRLYPAISYTYTKRDSNAPAYDFDKHRFQIEMNYRF